MLAKDADIRAFRLGELEFHFAPSPEEGATAGFMPPQFAGVTGEEEQEEETLPPAYRKLFPNLRRRSE